MPIFDLVCRKCGREIDDFLSLNGQVPECCKKRMEKRPVMIHSGFPEFGITLDHVEDKPVHFSSRRELIKYKREHNLQLGALPYD